MGNGAQMVAENVVNSPIAGICFLGHSYRSVSIASNPEVLGGYPGTYFAFATAAKIVAGFCLMFQRTFMQFCKSLKEATLTGSFFL